MNWKCDYNFFLEKQGIFCPPISKKMVRFFQNILLVDIMLRYNKYCIFFSNITFIDDLLQNH